MDSLEIRFYLLIEAGDASADSSAEAALDTNATIVGTGIKSIAHSQSAVSNHGRGIYLKI